MLGNLETNDITKNTKIDLIHSQYENIGKRICWTTSELELLKNLYSKGDSLSEIVKYFPNRTKTSINVQIKRQINKKYILPHTKEQKNKIWSVVRIGCKNPQFKKPAWSRGFTKQTNHILKKSGEKLSSTIKEKISKGEWDHMKGDKNGMYGKISWNNGLTKNSSEKIKKASKKGSFTMRKKWENMSLENKEFVRQRILKSITPEIKKKMRISAINRINRDNLKGRCRNYNPNACKYMDKLNENNGWNLQHALNGGEVEVSGYFLDGYDKEKNIVVEYDEPHHNKPNVKRRDEIRQLEIISELKCKFYRYDELNETLKEVK